MSDVMCQLSDDDPLMIAWRAYQATEAYANTKRWAAHPEHLEGSLWAVFMAGFLVPVPDHIASTRTPMDGEVGELISNLRARASWDDDPACETMLEAADALLSLQARCAELVEALGECSKRLRSAAIAGGTAEEYADIAVARYVELLALSKDDTGGGGAG